jgi:tetrahydromethanopterin S-methyltransferase subunit D
MLLSNIHGRRLYFLMDAGGIGALIGVGVMVVIGISVYVYDRCIYKPKDEYIRVFNPLLQKKPSFKVKNLFNHVEL